MGLVWVLLQARGSATAGEPWSSSPVCSPTPPNPLFGGGERGELSMWPLPQQCSCPQSPMSLPPLQPWLGLPETPTSPLRGPQRGLGAATRAGTPPTPGPQPTSGGWKQLKSLVAREDIPQLPSSGARDPHRAACPPSWGTLGCRSPGPHTLGTPSARWHQSPAPLLCWDVLGHAWCPWGGGCGTPVPCACSRGAGSGHYGGVMAAGGAESPPAAPLPARALAGEGSPPQPPPPLFFSPLKGKNGAGDNG